MIHGLSGSPYSMKDMGQYFESRCFLTRAILLPGHGTRGGDLLEIKHNDWVEAVDYGISTLKLDVENIFLAGFSLGGALAVNASLKRNDIKAVLLFSPALEINSSMAWTTPFLRYIVTWIDTDEPEGYARYEAMPMNAIAEVYTLSDNIMDEIMGRTFPIPLFMAQSMDDAVINAKTNLDFFRRYAISTKSVMINFEKTMDRIDKNDRRIHFFNSHFPDKKIVNFSHLSVHTSPEHLHYGEDGDFKQCEEDIGNKSLKQ